MDRTVYDQGNLIKLFDVDDDFIVDLKYAKANNFTGHIIYNSNECWIDKHTAEILIKARNIFKRNGYKVKIWDAYRPISAQAKFWEVMPNDEFVARPPDMSKIKKFRPTHMNGLCVDITLTDMYGNDIKMPSEFDDMSEKSSLKSNLSTPVRRKNATYMKEVMESVGFEGYENEWWHFYDVSTEPTPFMDFQI
ncbi:MAG TPA: M15 family metallopeptidase [Anaerovoracaceae bacterium]|nr:M15 family metallopeptidase [Anaerovoracaceae bacterium]